MEQLDFKKLREKVGVIPWWISCLPHTSGKIRGIFFGNRIFFRKDLYDDFMSDTPSHYVVGVVIHELEHIQRAQEKGLLKYWIIYGTNSKFRYNEELACHRPQFSYYKKTGYAFDLKKRAEILSGSLYLWCVSYEKALEDLTQLWDNV